MMELGNALLGHSRGEYEFPDRNIIDSWQWQLLCELAGCDSCYGTSENPNKDNDFENDLFVVRSYWWGEDDDPQADLPNFIYKPTGFEIRWYKYAFRDAYMNMPLNKQGILKVFKKCIYGILKRRIQKTNCPHCGKKLESEI